MAVRGDRNESVQSDGQPNREELLDEKLKHLDPEHQEKINNVLTEERVLAESLHDLRPADVPYEHAFELTTSIPIC